MTAFQAFVKSQLKNNPLNGEKLPDAMKKLGCEWRSMSDSQKARYKAVATKASRMTGRAASGGRTAASKQRSRPQR